MRLLAEIGYLKVLFAKDCDYSAVIEALAKAVMVEEKGPHGCRALEPRADGEIGVKLIPDDSVSLPESRSPDLEKILELASERDKLRSKICELERELKKIREVATPKEE